MKFSKVGHARAAVSVTEHGVEGIIYDNPAKAGIEPVQDLEMRFNILNNKAKGAYQLFAAPKEKEGEAAESIRKTATNLVDALKKLGNSSGNADPIDEQLAYLKSSEMKAYSFPGTKSYEVEAFVNKSLRKSLKRTVRIAEKDVQIPDVIESILMALLLISDDDLSGYLEKIDAEEESIRAFLNILNKEYDKKHQKQNAIRSMQRQNVKSQPALAEEYFLLKPVSADHPKKKYCFDFMTEYAGADEAKKEEMLVRIRQLILLFFCGTDAYKDACDKDLGINSKSFGGILPEKEEYILGKSAFNDYYRQIDSSRSELFCYKEEQKRYKKEDGPEELKKKISATNRRIDYYYEKIHALADQTITDAYRQAVKEDLNDSDRFWIDYFQKDAVRQIRSWEKPPKYKLTARYLCTHAWTGWTAFMSRKYIDLGKAVYHFAMPDLYELNPDQETVIGEVRPEYRQGLSSFDYERIKAEENLDRDISTAISFAVNSFSRSVCGDQKKAGHEDVLALNEGELRGDLLEDTGKRILRFFGGINAWEENEEISLYALDEKGYEIARPMQQALYAVRNSAFHYTGKADTGNPDDMELLETMFMQEDKWLGKILRKKYYSNNVQKFYNDSDITRLMDFLYRKSPVRPPQIPSFNKIMNRDSAYIHPHIVKGTEKSGVSKGDVKNTEIFKGSLFFLLKEIYYYGFLQEKDVTRKFLACISNPDNKSAAQNERAYNDFIKRIKEIGENADLGQICQVIMTDYEMQNQNKNVKRSDSKDKGSYKHFRTLLYNFLRETFVEYLRSEDNKEIFEFIRMPKQMTEGPEEEEFCKEWNCSMYAGMLDGKEKGSLLKWYVAGHFLTPKQLNHLIGDFKTYIWYIKDIERRAEDTGNSTYKDRTKTKACAALQILKILEFVMYFCGQTSNHLDDYFSDEEEYARTLSKIVSFKDKSYPDYASALKAFCDRKVKITPVGVSGKNKKKNEGEAVQCGIYHDGMNPIANRNVILASMYSSLPILGEVTRSIAEKDIRYYYQKQAENAKYIKTGKCSTEEEQKQLREYQNAKNRVEMNDLITLADLTNDLMSQLVSWSYFRERDLMYFQLGYHYIKLFYTDAVPADDFRRKLKGKEINITDGAILYQIAAIYTYSLPVYGINKKGEAEVPVKAGRGSGPSITTFVRDYCRESMKEAPTYYDGLFMFEDISMHDDIIDFRDYIDHFKYYARPTKSIMDMYSEMYDRFFDYSLNYKKSVSYILPNILQRYFVTLKTAIDRKVTVNADKERSHALIKVKDVSSDKLTYKVEKKVEDGMGNVKIKREPVHVDARDEVFLESVRSLLEYRVEEKIKDESVNVRNVKAGKKK